MEGQAKVSEALRRTAEHAKQLGQIASKVKATHAWMMRVREKDAGQAYARRQLKRTSSDRPAPGGADAKPGSSTGGEPVNTGAAKGKAPAVVPGQEGKVPNTLSTDKTAAPDAGSAAKRPRS